MTNIRWADGFADPTFGARKTRLTFWGLLLFVAMVCVALVHGAELIRSAVVSLVTVVACGLIVKLRLWYTGRS